jgi:hypothetical protein
VAPSAGLAGEGAGEPCRPSPCRRIVRLRLRLLFRNGIGPVEGDADWRRLGVARQQLRCAFLECADLDGVAVGTRLIWQQTSHQREALDSARPKFLGKRLEFSGGLADGADRPAGPFTPAAPGTHLNDLE